MRKISVLLSMVALFSFVAITSVSAQERVTKENTTNSVLKKTQKSPTVTTYEKKIEAKKDSNFDGLAGKRNPEVKNTTAPAPAPAPKKK